MAPSEGGAVTRGPMQRGAVLEEMLRMLPPEVSLQVEDISKEAPAKPERPAFRRSQTQHQLQAGASAGSLPEVGTAVPSGVGGPSDIALQRKCASLEAQLDKWVGIAQLLASELAYREKRLWDWQMDNTNTKAILQKFKDRLKKGGGDGKGGGGGGGGGGRRRRRRDARGTGGGGGGGDERRRPTGP